MYLLKINFFNSHKNENNYINNTIHSKLPKIIIRNEKNTNSRRSLEIEFCYTISLIIM